MTEHKPRQRPTVIVRREFMGQKNMVDAMVPIIYDDLRRRLEPPRTLDGGGDIR